MFFSIAHDLRAFLEGKSWRQSSFKFKVGDFPKTSGKFVLRVKHNRGFELLNKRLGRKLAQRLSPHDQVIKSVGFMIGAKAMRITPTFYTPTVVWCAQPRHRTALSGPPC